MVSVDHFTDELRSQLRTAHAQGAKTIVITSTELSKSVRTGSASLEACCEAMQAEVRLGDVVMSENEVGIGMSICYQLPRA